MDIRQKENEKRQANSEKNLSDLLALQKRFESSNNSQQNKILKQMANMIGPMMGESMKIREESKSIRDRLTKLKKSIKVVLAYSNMCKVIESCCQVLLKKE